MRFDGGARAPWVLGGVEVLAFTSAGVIAYDGWGLCGVAGARRGR